MTKKIGIRRHFLTTFTMPSLFFVCTLPKGKPSSNAEGGHGSGDTQEMWHPRHFMIPRNILFERFDQVQFKKIAIQLGYTIYLKLPLQAKQNWGESQCRTLRSDISKALFQRPSPCHCDTFDAGVSKGSSSSHHTPCDPVQIINQTYQSQSVNEFWNERHSPNCSPLVGWADCCAGWNRSGTNAQCPHLNTRICKYSRWNRKVRFLCKIPSKKSFV